ncbi:MAG: L-serine dehydratase, partial [Paraglaciecola sp.]
MISVFDMFSVGIGPSSSHTVGPMRAAKEFCQRLKAENLFEQTTQVRAELFGSLGQTGKGHGTGKAVILGLLGYAPESIDASTVDDMLATVHDTQNLLLDNEKVVRFAAKDAIIFH